MGKRTIHETGKRNCGHRPRLVFWESRRELHVLEHSGSSRQESSVVGNQPSTQSASRGTLVDAGAPLEKPAATAPSPPPLSRCERRRAVEDQKLDATRQWPIPSQRYTCRTEYRPYR